MLTDADIVRRRPLWSALSELWLDTELNDGELHSIARAMVDGGYSLKETRGIYTSEVAPVVYMNLISLSGIWAGFDDEWLHNEIISSLRQRGRFKRLLLKAPRGLMFYATKAHWLRLEQLYLALMEEK